MLDKIKAKEIFVICCFVIIFILCGLLVNKTNRLERILEEGISIDTLYYPLEKYVTLTVYNSVESQCDDTPLITANGTKIDLEKLKKGEIKYCAVSRDLLKEIPHGSIIYLEGHGEYEVVDTMNKRFKNRVDILQDVDESIFKKNNIRIIKIK